ncbi:uncharacterized protein LOC126732728 [Quercus robur]|uniref:uncharacterized protein LOC126732728 n=1 Tax=Quercus robur TaxID=38942 RepID=UPI00216386E8|nr:uncharacterized protein LOC126732728 [Quercus robur]
MSPTPPPALPSQTANLKRKREQKGKEVMGAGQTLPPYEDKVQRASKQAKTGQKGAEKRNDPQIGPSTRLPTPMLNGEPLLANASIHDFQGGTAGYVVDAVEQALLLPEDMAELQGMRRHKVFLSLKRYLAMAVQASFWVEEMTNYCHRQMKEEEGRCIATVEAFQVADKSLQEHKKRLQEEEKERKYAAATLENVEKQAESQRLLLHSAENQLASSKTQIVALKKKLEELEKAKALAEKAKDEAEKAKDKADQHGYDVRVVEIEDALRAEVPVVCRTYCALVWDEALNQAGVKASSVLRKAKSIYYPPTIRLPSSSDSKAGPVSSEAGEIQGIPSKAPPTTNTFSKGAELAEDTTGLGDANKETVQGTELPLFVPKDLS